MVYFDSAASTAPSQNVLDAFFKLNQISFANPSSVHALGREGARLLEDQRKQLLRLFGVSNTHQAIFLSGASEANNLVLKGIAFSYQNRGKKILISSAEHPSVTEPAKELASRFGFTLMELPVNENGVVDPKTLEEAMDKDVILVSIIGVNNETGSINDLRALGEIVHRFPKAYFHSDLTQAIGKIDVPFSSLDLFSFSGHKIHGIKGSGALLYRSSIRFVPLVHGGGQENGMRSGTVSVPLSGSLVCAVEDALGKRKENEAMVRPLYDRLCEGLKDLDVTVNSPLDGSPYVLNFSLNHHKASVIVEALSQKGIYVSSVSACSSKLDKASSVLLAMGLPADLAGNAVRVSLSESNSLEEVDFFLDTLATLLREVHKR